MERHEALLFTYMRDSAAQHEGFLEDVLCINSRVFVNRNEDRPWTEYSMHWHEGITFTYVYLPSLD